jgi:quinol monooxygenase YgiN
MSQTAHGEILSVAIFQPLPGYEEASLSTMRALIAALSAGGYSRDLLYRDAKSDDEYILLRYWKSEEARRAALEDPEVLRCWAKLSHEIRTLKIYETLEEAISP